MTAIIAAAAFVATALIVHQLIKAALATIFVWALVDGRFA